MRRTVAILQLVVLPLLLTACGTVGTPYVRDRSHRVTFAPDRIVLDVYVDIRESALNIEGPFRKGRREIKVELIGPGTRKPDGVYYTLPGDIRIFPHEGVTGTARITPDRKTLYLETYWNRRDGGRAETVLCGQYSLENHDELPADALVVDPPRLRIKAADAGIEQSFLVRAGSPIAPQITPVATLGLHPVPVRLEKIDERTWRVLVTPPPVADLTSALVPVRALTAGHERHQTISLLFEGDEQMRQGTKPLVPGDVSVVPSRLEWTVGEGFGPKTAIVRTASPAELTVVNTGEACFSASLERTSDPCVARLTVTPTDKSGSSALFTVHADTAGEKRRTTCYAVYRRGP